MINLKSILTVLSSVPMDLATATNIAAKVSYFVQVAEAAGGTGAQKLAAVENAFKAWLAQAYPDLAKDVGALWTEVSGLITGVVSIYRELGVFVGDVEKVIEQDVKPPTPALVPEPEPLPQEQLTNEAA